MKKLRKCQIGEKIEIGGYPFVIAEHKGGNTYLIGVGEGMSPEEWENFRKKNRDVILNITGNVI